MLIDCKTLSDNLKEQYKKEIENNNYDINLIVIMVGNNPASEVYVRNKQKSCEYVGIKTKTVRFNEDVTTEELISNINIYNNDKTVNGVMVQLPIPKHLDADAIINSIDPLKDVDGLTDTNMIKLQKGKYGIIPCTPKGIIKILDSINFKYIGSDAVVLGRSDIVGKPIAKLLMDRGCTVTMCHSKTYDKTIYTSEVDLIVSSVGKPKFLSRSDLSYDREKQVIIDVGINRDENNKLCGDVDNSYYDIKGITGHTIYEDSQFLVTPVPKGVGPMTVTMLLENTIEAYKLQNRI